jgi:hypothetical protein
LKSDLIEPDAEVGCASSGGYAGPADGALRRKRRAESFEPIEVFVRIVAVAVERIGTGDLLSENPCKQLPRLELRRRGRKALPKSFWQ